MHRKLALTALLAGLCLGARTARAGNDEGILIGGQAALTGGAVTAITGDGAAAWYNPAGLARVHEHTLDLNASVYGISVLTAKGLFTLPDGSASNASVVDWQLIPSALSYTRVLAPRWVGSFGVFIPSTTDVDLRSSVTLRDGTRWSYGADQVRNQYDYIASVGLRVSDTLRVGFALHGIYVSQESMGQVATGMLGGAGPFVVASEHEVRSEYGLGCGLGVQWTVRPELELGLAVQTPNLVGFRTVRRDVATGGFGADATRRFGSEHVDRLTKPWAFGTPFVVRAGAAYTLGTIRLLADATISSPLDAAGRSLDRRLNGNARVGVLVTPSARLSYGAGLFSDRNGFRSADASFLGVAGGVRLATHYVVREGERHLTFATTLAGRYAYGWGETEAVSFVAGTEFARSRADLSMHELAFNLGGAVTF